MSSSETLILITVRLSLIPFGCFKTVSIGYTSCRSIYFPAVIPKGTLMYHAGSKVPTTFEWLAMDHEFSYSFGLRSPSYREKIFGKKAWEVRQMAPTVIIKRATTTTTRRKRSGFTKIA
ncbi:AEL_HP2_G0050310.mRNA.1.CDS.1 [Saccharomyces cerevisiae]|nr:AEL_HP2_G0050310.mRNA.1.CDS.1 [Saccharomyces cerevisiae]CAI6709865.1 AEL_HP2_G0050310.mRNA.1.CDS.1 [Saccharomyces cerevisiae]